jgi:hypothetical protein
MPPPIGGWDTREALADMPEDHAVILDNWFPSTDRVTLRRGITEFATGLSGNVETLIPYVGVSGASTLFAVNDGKIYDISSGGAIGSAVVSGLSNDRFQYTAIGTGAGQFIIAMNGADTPRTYNGSSWANASISGPTAANLVWCQLHQRRLWFGETQSLSAWYLPVNSISGTATEFSIKGLASRGGYIMAMGTWSRDSGAGADDVAVFYTSEGEAVVYSGTDPSSAATWSLVGVFQIGRPIGRRCMMKAGADLIMVTEDGFVPASKILSMDRSQAEVVALSAQINKAVNDAVRENGTTFGWQPFIYPRATMMIFNIPQSSTVAHQYVFNTLTGAPCRFTGINAFCWALKGDLAYCGGNGVVYQFDDGNSDAGTNISSDAVQAFSYFGSPSRVKKLARIEVVFQSDGDPNAAIDINTDFQIKAATAVATASPSGSARWGIGKWGIGKWGSADQIYRGWKGIRGYGRSMAVRVRVNTSSGRPSWIATNWLYTEGGNR